MKNNKKISGIKQFVLFILSGLILVSCKKDNTPAQPYKDYHQTAVTKFISVEKTTFAYRELGNAGGIPLVMISALGNSMDDWDPAVTNGLAKRNKVILIDIEGVGKSVFAPKRGSHLVVEEACTGNGQRRNECYGGDDASRGDGTVVGIIDCPVDRVSIRAVAGVKSPKALSIRLNFCCPVNAILAVDIHCIGR